MRATLPNSAHLANVGGFLRTLDSRDPRSLRLTLHPRWVSVHPFALSLTAAMGAVCLADGGTVRTGRIPSHRSIAYLIRMGLFRALNLDPGRTITEHEASGRFVPLTQIQTAADLKAVITNLVPLLHAPPAVADPIRYVFSEMARNIIEHAGSPIGGYVCAQYYRRSNRIAIGIADAGIGIHRSITRHHAARTDAEAIRLALQPGVTGTTRKIGGTEFNAGAGLFFTKSIAALSRNLFVVYSGGSVFKLLRTPPGQHTVLHADPALDRYRSFDAPPFRGTAIGIDISVSEDVAFAEVLNQIRQAYSIDVKRKRKAYYKRIRFVR